MPAIQYVGPKDEKVFQGMIFPRLEPVEVPDAVAHKALRFRDVFLPATKTVPAAVLALRDKLPDALVAEAKDHIKQFEKVKARAEDITGDDKDTLLKREGAIKGAEEEIAYGESLLDKAAELREQFAAEKAAKATRAGKAEVK